MKSLTFGYNRGLPADAEFAFGARLIVTQDGHVDFVHDRTSVVAAGGIRADLERMDDEYPGRTLIDDIKTALLDGSLDTRDDDEITVVRGGFTMKASCQSSAGYCYVVVFPTVEVPV